MIGRVTCADLAELRSAYVDGSLRPADRERVAAHLAGCDHCRGEIDELRQVRDLLAQPRAEVVAADLSTRLMAIAHDDEHSRATHRFRFGRGPRRVVAGVVLTGVVLVTAAGVGYAAAPPVAVAAVSDPTAEARSANRAALAELPLTPVAVAGVADVPARTAAGPIAARPLPTEGAAITSGEVRAVLERALGASHTTSFRGTQSYAALDGDRLVSAQVQVSNRAGVGAELATRTDDGVAVGDTVVPGEPQTRVSDGASFELLTRSYTLSGRAGASAVGREATLVEARQEAGEPSPNGAVAARWWVDTETGVVLWQERYGADGAVEQSVGFLAVAFDEVPALQLSPSSVQRVDASLTLSTATGLASEGWPCHDRLGALTLVRLRSDSTPDPAVVQMVYSDGVTTATVLAQRGTLADTPQQSTWDATLGSWVTGGSAPTATWQSADTVFTVVAESGAPLADIVAALPHESRLEPSTMERIRAGWTRILGTA